MFFYFPFSVVKIQNKIAKAVDCLQYFATHEWKFKDDNVHALLQTLSPKDRETFIFDVTTINWEKYMERYVLGFRQFLFKQKPQSLPVSRKRLLRYEMRGKFQIEFLSFFLFLFLSFFVPFVTACRLYYINQLTKLLMVIFTWRFLMTRSKRLNALWSTFLQNLLKIMRLLPFL